MGTPQKCHLQRGVRCIEALLKLAFLLQIPAPKCIGIALP